MAAPSAATTSLPAAGARSTRERRGRSTTSSARCGSSWRPTRRSLATSSPCAVTGTASKGDPLKFLQTELPGVVIVEPDVFRDARGFFLETFHAARYRQGGIPYDFVQDNHSRSVRGDRKSTRLNSSHSQISYAVFCLKQKYARSSSPD